MVELGRIDIATEVSLLSSHLAYPCKGHHETALHIMSYLSQKHNTQLIFDPTYPKIDMGQFPQYNWTKFYGNVEEAIPVEMPGPDLDVCMMCDSVHAGDKRTRCSCTGVLMEKLFISSFYQNPLSLDSLTFWCHPRARQMR
jgi:hypothetical protein